MLQILVLLRLLCFEYWGFGRREGLLLLLLLLLLSAARSSACTYVSIRMSAYAAAAASGVCRQLLPGPPPAHMSACVSIRQDTSGYVSIRCQSGYVRIRQDTSASAVCCLQVSRLRILRQVELSSERS